MLMTDLAHLVEELREKFSIEIDLDSKTAKYKTWTFNLDLKKAEQIGFKKYILGIDSYLSVDERIKIRKRRYNFAILAYDSQQANCENLDFKKRLIFKQKADKILNYSKFYKSDLFEFDRVLDQLVEDPESVDIEAFEIQLNKPFDASYN
ncbi:hypothetical protein DRJ22_04210 [Candidatus Woesearchaeota archaeon]|nr:MAG: hypothetical protein DRJ22_04210 [Candidatus Woesearchaeota archaeon]